ncbi:MAG: D-cysteine desulfhydrase family protein [Thermodesulfobacteriota bacterium]
MNDIESICPPYLKLAQTPTPLQPLPRLGKKLGLELYVKRDDLTGAALSGNKVRKLEFVMAEALDQGADTVLTCGGVQSNHCRTTAVAAARLGLKCRLILRTDDPASPPPLEANSLLDRLVGADIVWINRAEYRNREEVFRREAESVERAGGRPYVIPEGASNALGAWGYIRAMAELAEDLSRLARGADDPVTVIYAAGSGGTGAGLILGQKLLDFEGRIVGINVCDDRQYFVNAIGEICERAIARFGLDVSFSRKRDVEIIDGYVGRGYAESSPDELKLIRDVARTEGVVLDPVYTAKAFFGLTRELELDPHRFGKRVVFIHTGGLIGLFPKTTELMPFL